MSSNGLDVPPPPKKRTPASAKPANDAPKQSKKRAGATKATPKSAPTKFDKVAETDKVQFNKRIKRGTADGFEMLAIKTRKKVPQLLAEALELLEGQYGKS